MATKKTTSKKTTQKKVALKKPVIRPVSRAAEKKPIISLGALFTLVIFAAVVLLAVYLSRQKQAAEAEATPAFKEPQYLFDKTATVSAIEVKPAEGEAVKLARLEEKGWQFELPEKGEADQAAVEAAASQLSSLRLLDTLSGGYKPADFGLETPQYVISVTFSDGKTRRVEIGDASPINTGYYVRVDKGPIQLVELSGIDALTLLATNPPYPPTPTPPTTEEPTAVPSQTPTPIPTFTPQPTPTP